MTTIDSPAPTEWDTRLERAHAAYPASASGITRADTGKIVKREEVFVRVLRDLLAVDNVPVQRGQRLEQDLDEGRRLLYELRPAVLAHQLDLQ